MIDRIKRFVTHPLLRPHAMGSPEWFAAQSKLFDEKPLVQRCYALWYDQLLRDADSTALPGAIVELGSGSSRLKLRRPDIIASDVVPGAVDLVADGTRLPFRDSSVRALLLTHVFHHIPDAGAFLREASRVLIAGGVISMVDCAHTPFSRFFFGRVHPEPYRDNAADWSFPPGNTMLDSNQALTWIVFQRDRARFEKEHPDLLIERRQWLPWFSYLLSGGVNLRSFVPPGCSALVQAADWLLKPLDPLCAIHWHWTIRKVTRDEK
ncbi:MAG: class I SAM-dependent methyltransferase [Bryobacterales bacterium]|nr:class I SAM-dependent methyltransferase [Bryobacterales bacterium]